MPMKQPETKLTKTSKKRGKSAVTPFPAVRG
jgi:hypothetical protein